MGLQGAWVARAKESLKASAIWVRVPIRTPPRCEQEVRWKLRQNTRSKRMGWTQNAVTCRRCEQLGLLCGWPDPGEARLGDGVEACGLCLVFSKISSDYGKNWVCKCRKLVSPQLEESGFIRIWQARPVCTNTPSHVWLLKFKWIKMCYDEKFSSLVTLATFQLLNSTHG